MRTEDNAKETSSAENALRVEEGHSLGQVGFSIKEGQRCAAARVDVAPCAEDG